MGLSERSVREFVAPILAAKGAWRLPLNCVAPFLARSRGLPQGLACSVLGSEVFLAIFLWRIHKLWHLCAICYVDDLNLVAQDAHTFRCILRELFAFASDFSVCISSDKSCVWGTHPEEIAAIGAEWGVPYKAAFQTLGSEWTTHKKGVPVYAKENARIAEGLRRLARLQHLPTTLVLKAQVAAVGVLSLTDFCPPPLPGPYKPLRSAIKKVLGCLHASSEIVLNVILDSSSETAKCP